jgi:hypothetical protein
MEALEGERRPGAVADDALEADAVVALDVHRGVDAEPAGSLPDPPAAGARHTLGVVFLKETLSAEVAEDAALDEALEAEPVVGGEPGGLVEAHGCVGRLVEDAVEDDPVDVEPSGPGGRGAKRIGPSIRETFERSSKN